MEGPMREKSCTQLFLILLAFVSPPSGLIFGSIGDMFTSDSVLVGQDLATEKFPLILDNIRVKDVAATFSGTQHCISDRWNVIFGYLDVSWV